MGETTEHQNFLLQLLYTVLLVSLRYTTNWNLLNSDLSSKLVIEPFVNGAEGSLPNDLAWSPSYRCDPWDSNSSST